jgi:hypothetical protein
MAVMTSTQTRQDARHDFDFLFGRWTIHNRKLTSMFEPGSTDWAEFPAEGEARPMLGGLGNVESYSAPDLPGRGRYEGMSLRIFDPQADLWRIWWASTGMPGRLDPAVEGRFTNGRGVFFGDDVLEGHPIKVRFDWTTGPGAPRWEQSFSFDEGQTWHKNWIMTFTPSP